MSRRTSARPSRRGRWSVRRTADWPVDGPSRGPAPDAVVRPSTDGRAAACQRGEIEMLQHLRRARRDRGRRHALKLGAVLEMFANRQVVVDADRSGTTPSLARASIGRAATSMPSISIWPLSGLTSPVIARIVVVLPAPFGPSSPVIDPFGTSNDTPLIAAVFRTLVNLLDRESWPAPCVSITNGGHAISAAQRSSSSSACPAR